MSAPSDITIIRFTRGGGVRKLFQTGDRATFGAIPRRASRVEVIDTGPHLGRFFVDFSPLGEDYQFCLAQPFDDYQDAVRAEQEFLIQKWI